ncbi:MAG: hypothetical protein AAB316_03855, partial [Bacteroidota bacterium]
MTWVFECEKMRIGQGKKLPLFHGDAGKNFFRIVTVVIAGKAKGAVKDLTAAENGQSEERCKLFHDNPGFNGHSAYRLAAREPL